MLSPTCCLAFRSVSNVQRRTGPAAPTHLLWQLQRGQFHGPTNRFRLRAGSGHLVQQVQLRGGLAGLRRGCKATHCLLSMCCWQMEARCLWIAAIFSRQLEVLTVQMQLGIFNLDGQHFFSRGSPLDKRDIIDAYRFTITDKADGVETALSQTTHWGGKKNPVFMTKYKKKLWFLWSTSKIKLMKFEYMGYW